jgi:hypothetical protein
MVLSQSLYCAVTRFLLQNVRHSYVHARVCGVRVLSMQAYAMFGTGPVSSCVISHTTTCCACMFTCRFPSLAAVLLCSTRGQVPQACAACCKATTDCEGGVSTPAACLSVMHWWVGGHLPIQACATCQVLCGGGGVMDHHPSRRPGRMSGWPSGRQHVCGGSHAPSTSAAAVNKQCGHEVAVFCYRW